MKFRRLLMPRISHSKPSREDESDRKAVEYRAFPKAYPAKILDSEWLMGSVNMTTITLHIQIRFP